MNDLAPLPPAPRESALRSYLHFAAYGFPCLFFVIFANFVLVPRMSQIWNDTGEEVAQARWILDLCSIFGWNFQYFVGGATALLVMLEKIWPSWQRLRSPVIRIITWIMNFSVILGMTWMAIAATLVVPRAISKPPQTMEPQADEKIPH